MKGAMQCLYWLLSLKFLTPQLTSVVDAMQFMGCDYFKHLHQGENAKWKGQRIISEFIEVMMSIREEQLQDFLSATLYLIMIDETTDKSCLKEMILYAQKVTTPFF